MPSSAPSTAARNHPILSLRCRSACLIQFLFTVLGNWKQQGIRTSELSRLIVRPQSMFSCMFRSRADKCFMPDRTYDFIQLDVFTQTPLAGNPLAIFRDARGLTDTEMQAVAREMNRSEERRV